MTRKLLSILTVLLLLFQLPLCALAAQEDTMTIHATYWAKDALYSFAHFPQEHPENEEISLIVNGVQQAKGIYPEQFHTTGATIHYVLLVDTSTSMSGCRPFLSAFAEELMNSSGSLNVSIASIDKDFRAVASDLTNWNDVRSYLNNLRFDYDGSDICGGTAKALVHLGGITYRPGDLINLVLITDGEPWYTSDAAVESEKEVEANALVKKAMSAYPEIIVNTLCFRKWEKNAFAAISGGTGLHLSATTVPEAKNAAKIFAANMNSMYTVKCPLPGYSDLGVIQDSIQLVMGIDMFSVEPVRNIDMHVPVGDSPIVFPFLEDIEPTPTTEPTEEMEVVLAPTIEKEEIVEEKQGMSPVILIAGIAAVVVILVLAALLILQAKKKKSQESSIRMQVEVLAGDAVRKKAVYYLNRDLVIGTDAKCDIVIRDPYVAPMNTRIFIQGQLICIEDMGSPMGTALNGMRLFSSNRLRSEDEITIGNTVLRVLF